jgi:hypothetical protein
VKRVSPNERKLRKELENTLRTLESWEGSSLREAAGRCLRWLGEDEQAAEQFRIAARGFSVGDSPQAYSLIISGNLHRLAGDHEAARALFGHGRDLLLTKIERELEDRGEDLDKDVLLLDLTYLNLCCFFLGRYEEVEDLEAFERRVDPGSTISWTGRLARAKRLGDLGEAIRAADEVSESIRRHRSKVTDTGLVNDWDFYELALLTEAELENEYGEGASPGAGTGAADAETEAEAEATPGPSPQPGPTKEELVEYVDSLQYGEVADLSGADLSGADLSGQLLMQAMLADADLRGADLSGANLRGADLSGASLYQADLSGADLTGADLRGADFEGADLEGAILEDTIE